MGHGNFIEDFRIDAGKLVTERGHSFADVSRIGFIDAWVLRRIHFILG